jgi:2-succinyl-5-enolpyruvyl-6-hydroxy-3-cyclohexene-1-carboxylate synthase
LSSSDTTVKKFFKKGLCDAVIRIGGVPTLRFWRDLEMDFKSVPVTSFSHLPYTGLARQSELLPLALLTEVGPRAELAALSPGFAPAELDEIFKIDRELAEKKEQLLKKYPLSEAALVRGFSEKVGREPVYIGNSLPIRHWDQFACGDSSDIAANRGANGIDGQISTYLGWSEKHAKSYCLVGDLTALYDLAALGLGPQLSPHQRVICVLNNYGGQIFSRVFNNAAFINAHQLEFSPWARLWGWSYQQGPQPAPEKTPEPPSGAIPEPPRNLIYEINPDAAQSADFWREWDELCRC